MKKFLLILLLISWLDAHSRLVLKRSYKYYKLGFDYYHSLLENGKKKAYVDAKKMCVDVVGSPYMNSIYKKSCLLGVEDGSSKRDKISLEEFFGSSIHQDK
jgi:hypothetical protein